MFIDTCTPGHMTKMSDISIYGKKPSKIFRTSGPMSTKLGMYMQHQGLDNYHVFINHVPVMTLTYFMARSTLLGCLCI